MKSQNQQIQLAGINNNFVSILHMPSFGGDSIHNPRHVVASANAQLINAWNEYSVDLALVCENSLSESKALLDVAMNTRDFATMRAVHRTRSAAAIWQSVPAA